MMLFWVLLPLFLIFASFLSVVTERLPLYYYRPKKFAAWGPWGGIMGGRSRCGSCGKLLRARDMIPLFSYLFLGGKCAMCKAKIPPQHFILELGALVLWGSSFFLNISFAGQIVLTLYMLISLSLLLIDARYYLLPPQLIAPLTLLALAWVMIQIEPLFHMMSGLLGAAFGAGLLGGLRYLYLKYRGVEALGLGDVYLMVPIGLWAGFFDVPFVLLIASLLIIAWAVMLSLMKRRAFKLRIRLPFGPGLILAHFILVLYHAF